MYPRWVRGRDGLTQETEWESPLVSRTIAALLSALQLLWLVAVPTAHAGPSSSKVPDAVIRSCNAQEVKRLKALVRRVSQLPQKRDSFGQSDRYRSEAAKLSTQSFTFYFYAFWLQGDDGQLLHGRDCTRSFARYVAEKGRVDFVPEFASIERREIFRSAGFDAKPLKTVWVHGETQSIRPYAAGNAFGASVRVTGFVQDNYYFALLDDLSAPDLAWEQVLASADMPPDEARKILPRLVVKVTVEPMFPDDPAVDRFYSRNSKHHQPEVSSPRDITYVEHALTGRLKAFEIFDPVTERVYLTLAEMLTHSKPPQ